MTKVIEAKKENSVKQEAGSDKLPAIKSEKKVAGCHRFLW